MEGLIGLAFFFSYWISTIIGILVVLRVIDFLGNGFKINKSLEIDNDIAGIIFVVGLIMAIFLSVR